MSEETEVFLEVIKRYWKTLLKWVLRIHGLPEITVDRLYERLNSSEPPLMIDIRMPSEYDGTDENSEYGHIPDSLSIPILELEDKIEELQPYKDKEIVTMCPGGGMSLAAVEILNDAGFKDVKSLKGGTDLWHKKGYPTTTSSDQ